MGDGEKDFRIRVEGSGLGRVWGGATAWKCRVWETRRLSRQELSTLRKRNEAKPLTALCRRSCRTRADVLAFFELGL